MTEPVDQSELLRRLYNLQKNHATIKENIETRLKMIEEHSVALDNDERELVMVEGALYLANSLLELYAPKPVEIVDSVPTDAKEVVPEVQEEQKPEASV